MESFSNKCSLQNYFKGLSLNQPVLVPAIYGWPHHPNLPFTVECIWATNTRSSAGFKQVFCVNMLPKQHLKWNLCDKASHMESICIWMCLTSYECIHDVAVLLNFKAIFNPDITVVCFCMHNRGIQNTSLFYDFNYILCKIVWPLPLLSNLVQTFSFFIAI